MTYIVFTMYFPRNQHLQELNKAIYKSITNLTLIFLTDRSSLKKANKIYLT
jgi:hypothetical protein